MTDRKTAIVTGGGQGTGRAIVQALARVGFNVVAVGRTASKIEETIAALGTQGKAIVADLTDPDQVRRLFEEVDAHFGGVDVLVNNAASYDPFMLEEASDAQIQDQIASTLTAPIYCMREAIPRMRRRGAGDIVNITSQSVGMPQPFLTVYSAAKGGLEVVSQGLRYELKGEPFRIITVNVGTIAGAVENTTVPMEQLTRLLDAFERSGVARHFESPGLPPEEIAATVVHAVTAPRSSSNQHIVMRGK